MQALKVVALRLKGLAPPVDGRHVLHVSYPKPMNALSLGSG